MEAEKGVRENYTGRGRNLKQTGKKCIEELMHETTQMHGFMVSIDTVRYLRNVGGLLLILKWYIAIILFGKSYTATNARHCSNRKKAFAG